MKSASPSSGRRAGNAPVWAMALILTAAAGQAVAAQQRPPQEPEAGRPGVAGAPAGEPDRSGVVRPAAPGLGPPAAGREPAGADLIFGFGSFEQSDLIAWDVFVGQCNLDPECPTQLRFLFLCRDDVCEECVDSNDCLNNPTALGPTCSAGRCRCASDAECAANPAGPFCLPLLDVCGCVEDADCGVAGTACRETAYLEGATTCW